VSYSVVVAKFVGLVDGPVNVKIIMSGTVFSFDVCEHCKLFRLGNNLVAKTVFVFFELFDEFVCCFNQLFFFGLFVDIIMLYLSFYNFDYSLMKQMSVNFEK